MSAKVTGSMMASSPPFAKQIARILSAPLSSPTPRVVRMTRSLSEKLVDHTALAYATSALLGGEAAAKRVRAIMAGDASRGFS